MAQAEQYAERLPVVALPSGQAQSDREALPVDDRVAFGREPASGTTETMISIPLTWGQLSQSLCGYGICSLLVSDLSLDALSRCLGERLA